MEQELKCLDKNSDCGGTVEYRPAMSPTGRSFPRCTAHYDSRLEKQITISNRYNLPVYY